MKKAFIILIFSGLFIQSKVIAQNEVPVYKNVNIPINERVEDLLQRMTIEEKIGQMSQLDISLINTTGLQADVYINEEKARDLILNHHVGSFINGEAVTPQQWFEFIDKLTRIAFDESRLGIPIIYGIDHVHGASYMSETTIFPQPINLGATFNTEHSYNMGWVTALETADVGHHWNFAPTLDLGVNPIWPRLYETFGEDPYLTSLMGSAFITGYQGNEEIYPYKLAANAKHFIAYSNPVSGWDKTQVQIGMQQLRELHLPAFQAAIDAGVKTIMANSSEVNGTPVHSSHKFLTELLRDELGFKGVVFTDWNEVGKLNEFHRTATSYKEATYKTVMAGIDISMTPLHLGFNNALMQLYNEGRISEKRIDLSVRRVLTLKFELGLFENPFPRNDRLDRVGTEESRLKSLEAARESIVLLKNDNELLPLNDVSRILLAGSTANNKRNLAGGWTLAWQGGREDQYPENMQTVLTALSKEFPNATIDFIEDLSDPDNEILDRANSADIIIYVGGEEPYSEFIGNITDLTLFADQQNEINFLAQSDTPLLLVLVQGRPRIITDIYDNIDAFIHAGLPGFEGAEAIANVISGTVNPSGRLPFSYPKFTGHYVNYNHKPSDLYFNHPDNQNYTESPYPTTMLYEFGDGLSYTEFEFSNLVLNSSEINEDEKIIASVTVTNTGQIDGQKAVLWFLTNIIGNVSRPVKELKHFEKIFLEAGESKVLTFEIYPEKSLWYPDKNGNRIIEVGEYFLRVDDLRASFNYLEN